jgi:branched-chain amino acid transport system permease protein
VDVAIAVLSLSAMGAIWWILAKTRLGREMRAVADVPDLAVISGIDRRRVVRAVWIVTGALSGLAGILLGAKVGITPLMGWSMLLPSFAAAILGGVGSPAGAVLGGILLGIAAELSTFIVSPSYKVAIAFLVMTVVLLIRPTGIVRGLSRS